MSEKIMFYDGLFDEIAKKYTDHKSKRTKIGIVITHEELRALKSREQVLQQELGLTKLRLEQTDSSFKQADEAHSKVEAMYFESERKCKALLEALENWNKSFQSVIEHKHHFDTNVFNLFNERYIEAREAIQGEPG